jgi:hypothetical protein
MQTVDELPETIHLYVVREEEPRVPIAPIVLSVFVLLLVIVVGVGFPYQPPIERMTQRIPAVFLPLQTFSTSVPITPTGVKTYQATYARGILTVTNGSVVSQDLPQGLIFSTRNGIEVETKDSVFVPPGNAEGFGIASVPAQTVVSGKRGNMLPLSIDAVYGTSLYIRNLSPFTGGRDAFSIHVVTPQNTKAAIDNARLSLTSYVSQIRAFLAYPCNESSQIENNALGLSWVCQYVTYSVPSYMKVTHVRLVGNDLLVDVVFVPKTHMMWVK